MSDLPEKAILDCLNEYPDPETGRKMGSMGQIHSVHFSESNVDLTIGLTSHSRPIADHVCRAIESKIIALAPGVNVNLSVVQHERSPVRVGQTALRVKSVIAVGSGKGGVGKSTVACSLALSLRAMGATVGLMDADVYGPSVPHLLGLTGRPALAKGEKIEPIYLQDQQDELAPMPVMSMGFLVDPKEAVIWRGPMLHGSINQFLGMTNWGDLDYLIIDMPPGTGDVALTLSQAIPLAGSVVVCTPQEVALLDAVKAIAMFRKVNIPLLGMVENMSGFQCPDCGKTYDIFGKGGAREKAEELDVPFLGTLPIDIALRTAGDEGRLAGEIQSNVQARSPIDAIATSLVQALASKAAASPPTPSLPTL